MTDKPALGPQFTSASARVRQRITYGQSRLQRCIDSKHDMLVGQRHAGRLGCWSIWQHSAHLEHRLDRLAIQGLMNGFVRIQPYKRRQDLGIDGQQGLYILPRCGARFRLWLPRLRMPRLHSSWMK